MAKSTSQSRSRKSSPRSSASSSRSNSRRISSNKLKSASSKIMDVSGMSKADFKRNFRKVTDSTAVRYAVGGLGIFILGRLAVKMAGRYPQIMTYFREGFDELETKLSDFRGSSDIGASEIDDARH